MPPTAMNLLLISIDTLRADVAYKAPLPNLQSLYARGTAFRYAVSSAPITPASHASIFTGLQPYEHGIRHLFKEQLSPSVSTLADMLRRVGYQTCAIVSCPGLNKWYGLDTGFIHYDDEIPRLSDGSDPLQTVDVQQRGTALKRAPVVVQRGLAWLEVHRREPFFLFLHFFDTHWPYDPPESFAPSDANPYECEVHYVDHYLGIVLNQLDAWNLWDNTLIVLFSDHGEDLGGWYDNDHAGPTFGHPEERGHGCLLYDATQLVPLVFVGPELIPANRLISTQVRLVDLLPTVLELLHVPDTYPRSGHTLTGLFAGAGPSHVAYCETYYREEQSLSAGGIPGLGPWQALRLDNHYKVILDVNTGTLTLYDLIADPIERQPVMFGANTGSL